MFKQDLVSSRYIGDFSEGDEYHYGAVQITPARNREYIKKFKDGLVLGATPVLSAHLGYFDSGLKNKKGKFGIDKSQLVSQGFVFNMGFKLSVHDISFNSIGKPFLQ